MSLSYCLSLQFHRLILRLQACRVNLITLMTDYNKRITSAMKIRFCICVFFCYHNNSIIYRRIFDDFFLSVRCDAWVADQDTDSGIKKGISTNAVCGQRWIALACKASRAAWRRFALSECFYSSNFPVCHDVRTHRDRLRHYIQAFDVISEFLCWVYVTNVTVKHVFYDRILIRHWWSASISNGINTRRRRPLRYVISKTGRKASQ